MWSDGRIGGWPDEWNVKTRKDETAARAPRAGGGRVTRRAIIARAERGAGPAPTARYKAGASGARPTMAGLDVDAALAELGQCGRYQLRNYLLILVPIAFSAVYNAQYIFAAADVDYRWPPPGVPPRSPLDVLVSGALTRAGCAPTFGWFLYPLNIQ
ncbi:hypothetical protein EVAR_96606_1 [Eumeta japonica]|uniref:Uncharacterized protein n=1 Tax=Eumeta variegata TaxID=151549 RepID=A0A4C1WRA9_EUMVA|nr:hypothetical protein EVAR_96606_1 [Eumeta japonica]